MSGPSGEPPRVAIQGFAYKPSRVSVRKGDAVEWVNRDRSNHTVSFEEPDIKGIGNLRAGRRQTVTFNKRGAFDYVCDFHPGMAGRVDVR